MYYYIDPSQPYLVTLAKWLIRTYSQLQQVTVILPTGTDCRNLQLTLAEQNNQPYSFLPQILTLEEFIESLAVLNNQQCQPCSRLEERMILANKLTGFAQSNISWSKALSMSSQLVQLIGQPAIRDNILRDLIEESSDSPRFLAVMLEFLQDLDRSWHNEMSRLGKMSSSVYQSEILANKEVLAYITKSKSHFIIAGITEYSPISDRLLQIIASHSRGVIVLPQIMSDLLEKVQNITEKQPITHGLHFVQQLVTHYKLEDKVLRPLYASQAADERLTRFLGYGTDQTLDFAHIKYITVNNEFEELHLVALLVRQLVKEQANASKLAVVVDDHRFASLLCTYLARYGLNSINSIGIPLKETKTAEFLLLLMDYAINEGSLSHLINLIKSEYLDCQAARDLESVIIKRSPPNAADLQLYLEDSSELWQWYSKLLDILQPLSQMSANSSYSFDQRLRQLITSAEQLDIEQVLWATSAGRQVAQYFEQILNIGHLVGSIEAKEFYAAIMILLQEGRCYPANKEPSRQVVTILSSKEALFSSHEYLILPMCHEDNWPHVPSDNYWLPKKMLERLNIDHQEQQLIFQNYLFYILLNKSRVYLTRAKKYKGRQMTESRFVLRLMSMSKGLVDDYWPAFMNSLRKQPSYQYGPSVSSSSKFPLSISATNVELLIRNPYGFYAKKILKLSKPEPIFAEPTAAHFGTILHEIIADYTSHYDNAQNKLACLLHIGEKHFHNSKHQHFARKIWWPRFQALAENFIQFDQARRANLQAVFSEIRGETQVLLSGRPQTITAIADRIELSTTGELYILDYKSGAVPTNKDVHSGIACQLLVESIILQQGGFAGLPSRFPMECLYVKIMTRPPYIRTTSFKIMNQDFIKHSQGLIDLLDFFTGELPAKYLARPDASYAPAYDDYRHLARKMSW